MPSASPNRPSANHMQDLNGASNMYTESNLPTWYHAKSRSSNPKIGQPDKESYQNEKYVAEDRCVWSELRDQSEYHPQQSDI